MTSQNELKQPAILFYKDYTVSQKDFLVIIVFSIVIQLAGEASELLFIDFISFTPYINLTASGSLDVWIPAATDLCR